ncbi:MAG: hypothetical protein II062_02225 [Oscillospiraceae bacterium]|nr:hypothetical protein [Oscillospiraceae bacterium]
MFWSTQSRPPVFFRVFSCSENFLQNPVNLSRLSLVLQAEQQKGGEGAVWEAAEFGALYKSLINGNLAPESERAETVLQAVLRLLPGRDPPEKTVDFPKQA